MQTGVAMASSDPSSRDMPWSDRIAALPWLEGLVGGGTSEQTASGQAKRIRLLNALGLTFIGIIVLYFPLLLSIGVELLYTLFMPVGAAIFGLAIVLNHRGRFRLARTIYFSNSLGLIISLICLDRTANLELLLIAGACMAFLFYGLDEPVRLLVTLLTPVVLFIVLFAFGEQLLPTPPITQEAAAHLRHLSAPTVVLCVILTLLHLCTANERAESRLQESLERLKAETQARIEHQRLATDEREKARIARAAGMAEVATGVLHNVGNILNSVNVSSCLLEERLRQGNGAALQRAAGLVRSGGIEAPEKRAALAQYLEVLAQQADQQRTELSGEVSGLRKNIEHIQSVITMQQNYSRAVGVTESVHPRMVAEEALTLYASSRQRHQVALVIQHEELPELQLDRHKVLQILVNLIRNAMDALKENPPGRRKLEMRTGRRDGELMFEVTDNGSGIAPEHLVRIFSHGFTTKSDGHGFGLHASSCLAKELHGTLTCHSAGPGTGSTFTLTLPFRESTPS